MPSWSTRLNLGSPASNHVESSMLISDQEGLIRRGQHQDIRREEESFLNTDSPGLSKSSISARPFYHGRSLSQPFTYSQVGGEIGEKSKKSNIKGDIETRNDHSSGIAPGILVTDLTLSGQKGSPYYNDSDFIKGRCATCSSLVRWPRLSDCFRCTVCLMVNDLKPPFAEQRKIHGSSTDDSTHSRALLDARKPNLVPYVSLPKTKGIIEDCIALYLKEKFGSPNLEIQHEDHKPLKETQRINNGLISNQLSATRASSDQGNISPSMATQNQIFKSPQSQSVPTRPATHYNLPTASSLNPLSPDRSIKSQISVQQPPSRAPPPPPITALHKLSITLENEERTKLDLSTSLFRPLENYIIACFTHCSILNASFPTTVPSSMLQGSSEAFTNHSPQPSSSGKLNDDETLYSEIDAKTLLLGDFAENGMWWTGRGGVITEKSHNVHKKTDEKAGTERVSHKTLRIHWGELSEWYYAILSAGCSWKTVLRDIQQSGLVKELNIARHISIEDQAQIEKDLSDACSHVQRTLLKASENLLRRPGGIIQHPEDSRFLCILLANPLLKASDFSHSPKMSRPKNQRSKSHDPKLKLKPVDSSVRQTLLFPQKSPNIQYRDSSAHKNAGIVKRIFGIISNLPNECQHQFISWLSRSPEVQFRRIVDLVGAFVTHRLSRQRERKRSTSYGAFTELVPSISGSGLESSAQLHTALGITGTSKASKNDDISISYAEDWQIKGAAKFMSLLCFANSTGFHRRQEATKPWSVENGRLAVRYPVRYGAQPAQSLPTSAFYNSLLDCLDLIADFEAWESRTGKFSFCQYPMFLSIWAKIRIMEYDARRQMETKAREAFFISIMGRKAISQHLLLKVRRECLVEDSLRGVSEIVGAGQEEIKKELRIEFRSEEGIDAGGLRKEWFLLLVREVFDPEHGLFIYDDDSQCCYFNPNSFETSDQFFLVGVVLGLAIYNSTILDVALPPFAFRKLLASAPSFNGPAISVARPTITYSLEDLAELHPLLAKGLGQLLEYDGNVEETFCRNFVVEVNRYGQISEVPLCPDGENRSVNNTNRREFIDLYVRYLLDSAVSRQFEPFKRGFFTVCSGNALSLFRPDEIELLVRGSDEPLDVSSLRAVAVFDGWSKERPAEDEMVIVWFWELFAGADAKDQRKLLHFITSSDRIPAMGAASLVIKLTCLGNDINRFPIARTCFNMLGLYRYPTKQALETKLWRAVRESGGFGMK